MLLIDRETNANVFRFLQLCFRLPQTLGCIGGKPNHAYYFIGYLGKKNECFVLFFVFLFNFLFVEPDELLYLDPHTAQTHVDTTMTMDDTSYHSDRVNRMKFSSLDPSLALVTIDSKNLTIDRSIFFRHSHVKPKQN